jgi:hypothetical protein
MLHSFRRIRQRLLTDNRFSKYLLYAAGEIILVVIGILIALQINTWNEQRKIRASEQEILHNLKAELISNRDRLNDLNEMHLKEYEDGLTLLKLFGTDVSNIPESQLDALLGNIESGNTFEANDGYIKSLIASDKIDHLRNDELKTFISSFEAMVVDATQEVNDIKRLLNERLWPATDGKISTLKKLQGMEIYADFPRGTYPSDYDWFFANRELEDIIAGITAWKKELIVDEQSLSETMDGMIRLIEKELNP